MNKDTENQLHPIFHELLNKLNLVSREDFEIQSEVLKRTRARLAELERRLALLEQAEQAERTEQTDPIEQITNQSCEA